MEPAGKEHIENDPAYKGLRVNEGIEQPPAVHPESVKRFLQRKRKPVLVDELFSGLRQGNISLLSKAVTLVESSKPDHQEMAQDIILRCLPFSGNSLRIGITGVPGVGKSTFIETLGILFTSRGNKLAVLAIDPSSERTKGSILGDKTRMETLSSDPRAYIRPSPSAGSLGGVARKTRETIILCEAAGFDTVFIETVGVGQSETAVRSMTDFFLLLMLAGAGDDLQGIKRGIMEMADMIVVNKADGSNIEKAMTARSQLMNALHFFPPRESGWEPRVLTCSATQSTGITEILLLIDEYARFSRSNGYFTSNRNEQSVYWLQETIDNQLRNSFYNHPQVKKHIQELREKVTRSEISSFVAANQLLSLYYHKSGEESSI